MTCSSIVFKLYIKKRNKMISISSVDRWHFLMFLQIEQTQIRQLLYELSDRGLLSMLM